MKEPSEVQCLLLELLSCRVASGCCVPQLKVTPSEGNGLYTLPTQGSSSAHLPSPGSSVVAAQQPWPQGPCIILHGPLTAHTTLCKPHPVNTLLVLS